MGNGRYVEDRNPTSALTQWAISPVPNEWLLKVTSGYPFFQTIDQTGYKSKLQARAPGFSTPSCFNFSPVPELIMYFRECQLESHLWVRLEILASKMEEPPTAASRCCAMSSVWYLGGWGEYWPLSPSGKHGCVSASTSSAGQTSNKPTWHACAAWKEAVVGRR